MSEKLVAEWVEISKIKPWDKNPRVNDDAAKRVADSIRRFGFGAPILARLENGEIIAGHTRYKAAKLLGLSTVPVRYLDLSEHDAHLLALADNKLGEIAEWDDVKLGEILSTASFSDALTAGWSGDDLGKMASAIIDSQDTLSGESVLNAGLTYSVVVECVDETQQGELIETLEAEGYKCRPLIS